LENLILIAVAAISPQVVLLVDAAEVDKSRLQKLLREGIYVEYHGRKVLEAKTFENNCHVLLNFHIFF